MASVTIFLFFDLLHQRPLLAHSGLHQDASD